jgi:hypothetical protein
VLSKKKLFFSLFQKENETIFNVEKNTTVIVGITKLNHRCIFFIIDAFNGSVN